MAAVNYGFNHFTNGSLALNYTRNKFALRFNYQVKYEDDINDGYLYRYYVPTVTALASKSTPCGRSSTTIFPSGSPSSPTCGTRSMPIFG